MREHKRQGSTAQACSRPADERGRAAAAIIGGAIASTTSQQPVPFAAKAIGGAILGLLCMINFFNYVDRMIVAGAPIEFGQFISETLDVPAHKQAFFLGIITPAFMVTFLLHPSSLGT